MFGGCYFGQHSDLQHVVPLFYSKILLKKTINQSMQFTSVLWNNSWRGKICSTGCWGIWRVSGPLEGKQCSHPTEHTTLLTTFPRHVSQGGSISCLQRESKCQSAPPHTCTRVTFYWGGWEICRDSSKLLKTPAKPMWKRAGLRKSPMFLISSAACCQLLRAIWFERQFFSL